MSIRGLTPNQTMALRLLGGRGAGIRVGVLTNEATRMVKDRPHINLRTAHVLARERLAELGLDTVHLTEAGAEAAKTL